MDFQWFLPVNKYIEYKTNQQHSLSPREEGDYIGSVRTGELCFDILDYGTHLWFDLYVGGVDSGYSYSNKEDFKDYPYDYADKVSFCWDKNISRLSFEEFKNDLSVYMEQHLQNSQEYLPDFLQETVNLIEKANMPLVMW